MGCRRSKRNYHGNMSEAVDGASSVDTRLVLAYEAAKAVLSGQDTTLGNTRTRANNLLATAALLTSFAAGIGLLNPDPKKGVTFPALEAWLLLGVLVALAALVLYVLWTIDPWHFGPDPKEIMRLRAEGNSEEVIREFVIGKLLEGIDVNRENLRKKQAAFRGAAFLLLVESLILVWTLATLR